MTMIELERDRHERSAMMSVSRSRPDLNKAVPPVTDIFWIPVDTENGRRNSLGRRDSLASKTKCDRDVKESEKHWQLQRKVSDLSTQSALLEKRITALKEENEVLKKKTDEQKLNEEKVKKLKRRNSELASIARRLEEKVKQLQDSPKKVVSASPGASESVITRPTMPKTKTKERALEKVTGSAEKDQATETMKRRFQELLRLHRSTLEDDLVNKDFYTEQTELENIVKVAAKERLELEKQLVDEHHNPEVEAQLLKAVHLERRNAELTDEVERLTKFANDKEKLEVEVMQKRIEIEMLEKEISESRKKCLLLTEELQDVIVKNTQLTVVNTDIQRQIEELDQMAKNFNSLSASLAAAEADSKKAKTEAAAFHERIQTLEVELKYMEQVERKKHQLESEKRSLQESIQMKEQELDVAKKDNSKHDEAMKKLQLRLTEVETMYQEQLAVNEKMSSELRKINEKAMQKPARLSTSSVEIQTDGEATVTNKMQRDDRHDTSHERNHSTLKKNEVNNQYKNNQNLNISQLTDHISNYAPAVVESRHQLLEMGSGVTATGTKVDRNLSENGFGNGEMSEEDDVDRHTDEESIIRVFQAKFDYDPLQCSPNEEPEAELQLAAGDYMFVYGDMDEDGFYIAELLDGRRGLVPSNFVRQLSEEELTEFYSTINMDMQGTGSEVLSDGTHAFLDFSYQEDNETSGDKIEDKSMDISFQDGSHDLKQQGIPDAPVNAQVESGPDHGCLMVSWLPVTITAAGTSNGANVAGYSIYIDGVKAKWLPTPTGDHVLLESDDFSTKVEPRCITVRTVTTSGQESVDSMPALLSPQLLQELKMCQLQDCDELTADAADTKEGSEDCKLNAENMMVYTASQNSVEDDDDQTLLLDSRPWDAGDTNFKARDEKNKVAVCGQETEDKKQETNDCRKKEAATEEVEAHITVNNSRPSQKAMLPETIQSGTVSSFSEFNNNNDGVNLGATHKSTVWKKVAPKSKLNSTIDTSDLSVVDPQVEGRTWKSLDPSDSKVVIVKSQSQEELGAARSDIQDNLSQSELTLNRYVKAKHWVSDTRNNEKPCQMSETKSDDLINLDSTSLVGTGAQKHMESFNTQSGLVRHSPGKPVAHTDRASDHCSSTVAEHFNGHSSSGLNELDDNASSSSELIDNNALTSKKIRDDIPDSDLIDYSDDGGESLMESVECDQDVRVRIFIALFSYDPETMSPNPDAISEELSFREGQIIKIYGDKDQDGFFLGEINHQRGLVPCNMISEVHVSNPDVAAQLLEESRRQATQSAGSSRTSSRTSDFTSRTHSTISVMGVPDDERLSPVGQLNPENVPEQYVIALYNYDPQELSPNADAEEELSFQKGDIIKVFGDIDEDGFYYGQLNNRFGLIPSNFVKEAPPSAVYYTPAV